MKGNDPLAYDPFKGVGRNDPCPCGSGRKFKKCCLGKHELKDRRWAPEAADEPSATDREADAIVDYDPLVAPRAAEWLAPSEQERIDQVVDYHQRAGIRLPGATLHAVIHAVVENQIAEGMALPVQRTAQRLMDEGLDRHEAIHAIGSVLTAHMNDLVQDFRSNASSGNPRPGLDPEPNARYFAELERLTAEKWRRSD